MAKIRIIVVDRTRMSFLREGEDHYLGRLRKYVPVEWIEVKGNKVDGKRSPEEVMGLEGKRIQGKLDPRATLVVLDRSGRQYDSLGLARWMEGLFNKGTGSIDLVVGGPLGVSKEVLGLSRERLSLSRLTLTHEMCRLLLLEQLYRAMTILRGEKYHK
ncbi:MAG: 23S rRNA (pseudouridine(1915)-N(3))-methyltransferase RlmH [Deltaproteobacteria bacterium]|nr:23S rRNA (pseudouridine(1915)-N(3))-methyltransferase RlmH [Deltaproteobacteria bacterium]MBW2137143.1 23S rRNA (pseudouridine(1915)-N(3))-methyltransferase RlmH [Deltaproteobacteria bacterium]